ncbi:MAG: hypothetical protein KatS3mg077_2882 [Candidatus Binatia bacterium]|nr:MAG: hypothetical protein KatS3mg077_2882 [Candidatus Binatia bacterium]
MPRGRTALLVKMGVGGPDVSGNPARTAETRQPQFQLADPLEGKGRVTATFGEARPGHSHAGLDIAAPKGTRVISAEGGQVTHAGVGRTTGAKAYGLFVDVTHPDLGIKTRYAHLSEIAPGIAKGTYVYKGQLLGFVGSTGRSTGPHLHFEVILLNPAGTRVDPRPYLPGR